MKKLFLLLVMIAVFGTAAAAFTVSAKAESSGTCGDTLTWTLDDSGVLTISGTGEMDDYKTKGPWGSGITSVVFDGGVTSIGNYAFYGCSGLTSITIPGSATRIGERAFQGCGLTNVTISDGVTGIGKYAFIWCSGLTGITIPQSVTSIGEYAFCGCTGLTNISVDENNQAYDSRNNCNAIIETVSNTLIAGCRNTIIPDGVTSISFFAFYWCSALTSITIPDGVTSIGDSAFDGCSGLTRVAIPGSLTSIGTYAFYGCTGLTSIAIPDSVTSIGTYAFYGCTGLTSITIPDGLTSIEDRAFGSCTGIQDVTIPDSVTSIGNYALSYCSGLTSITISDSVTSIGSAAFSSCTGLTNITIPDSVTSIGSAAFAWCTGLTRVAIPDSATSIGDNAFYGCSSLSLVRFYSAETRDRFAAQLAGLNTVVCCKAEDHKYADGSDVCTVCGHAHLFAGQWETDQDNHWRVCTKEECMDKVDLAAHTPNSHGTCTVCGYKVYTPGDPDGDGTVTDWDGVLLERYLAGWEVEMDLKALDIDGDGRITDWDSVLFDRYIAGWSVESLLSPKQNHSSEITLPVLSFNSSRNSVPAGRETPVRNYIVPKRRTFLCR